MNDKKAWVQMQVMHASIHAGSNKSYQNMMAPEVLTTADKLNHTSTECTLISTFLLLV
jgi:hypothetical protein